MNLLSCNLSAIIAIAIFSLAGSVAVAAEDGAETETAATFPGAQISLGADNNEFTIEYAFGQEEHDDFNPYWGLSFRLPLDKIDGEKWSDFSPGHLQIMPGFFMVVGSELGGDYDYQLYRLDAEWGYKIFEYNRGNREEKAAVGRHSYTVRLSAFYHFELGDITITPQFKVRLSHEYDDADKTGVVIPGGGPGFDTVEDRILEGPVIKPQLKLDHATIFSRGQLGVGYRGRYSFIGDNDTAHDLFGTKEEARVECVLFYFLSKKDPGPARIGVGGYWQKSTWGPDANMEPKWGILAQVKLGGILDEY